MSMNPTKAYLLLSAASACKAAYKALYDAYRTCDDADFSKNYPLSPVDIFDSNTYNAVNSWLNTCITDLVAQLPDRVPNPACINCARECKHAPAIRYDGKCANADRRDIHGPCGNYPVITFDENVVRAYLQYQNIDPKAKAYVADAKSDVEVRLIYNNFITGLGLSTR